jgi:hypothetical protein
VMSASAVSLKSLFQSFGNPMSGFPSPKGHGPGIGAPTGRGNAAVCARGALPLDHALDARRIYERASELLAGIE